ncbi:acyltransferase family protein [Litorisediminicola beolgyonensis]|uniref:Acyltransferase family protein n=1 Tax=Litorisediminicola beolgyonensis TaxID=1173614 RepID=A0ABW3ZNC7_9RHOB
MTLGDRAVGRDNHFTLIRLLAATGVLVSHAFPLADGRDRPWREPLLELTGIPLGNHCVFVFFAISGFYVTRSFDQRRSVPEYVSARLLRLYPALAVNLGLTVLVLGLWVTTAPPGIYWDTAARFLETNLTFRFGAQMTLPGVFETAPWGPPVNNVLWSLYYEIVCYGAVLLVGMIGLFRTEGGLRIASLVAVALCLWGGEEMRLTWVGLPFAYGAALYAWRDRVPMWPLAVLALGGAAALAQGTALYLPLLQATLAYGVLVAGLWPAPRLLPFNRLGDYSYGVYIYAWPLQQLSLTHLGAETPGGVIAIALPLALLCAVASWHLVERPALGLRRPARRKERPA